MLAALLRQAGKQHAHELSQAAWCKPLTSDAAPASEAAVARAVQQLLKSSIGMQASSSTVAQPALSCVSAATSRQVTSSLGLQLQLASASASGASSQRSSQLAWRGLGNPALHRHHLGVSQLHQGASSSIFQQQMRGIKATSELEAQLLNKARKIAAPVGAMAGLFGGMVGVGGGVLIAPVIINACKTLPQRVVAGTSLAAVASTGLMAGSVYLSAGVVDLKSAALLAVSAMITAPLGARMTHMFDCNMLRRLLAYWLFLVAGLVPIKVLVFSQLPSEPSKTSPDDIMAPAGGAAGAAGAAAGADAATPGEAAAAGAAGGLDISLEAVQQGLASLTPADAAVAGMGIVAGLASGLLGIGGGTIVTPLLAVATGMSQLAVLGTSLCGMVPPSLVGLLQHHRLGNVDWPMAIALAMGTLAGSYAGSNLAVKAPDGVLEAAFSLGMLFLGRKTLKAAQAAAAKAAPVVSAAAKAAAGGPVK